MFDNNQKSLKSGKSGRIKRHTSKLGKYVIFSISFVILYSIAVLVVFAFNGAEPEVLTKCVYGFFAGEVVSAALIKIFNIALIERLGKDSENININEREGDFNE